jgi:hypothetical protein
VFHPPERRRALCGAPGPIGDVARPVARRFSPGPPRGGRLLTHRSSPPSGRPTCVQTAASRTCPRRR